MQLAAGGASLPHPLKARGEDAFFVTPSSSSSAAAAAAGGAPAALGVADGVGGWAMEGVDPSVYPQLLMRACQAGLQHVADPLKVLKAAHDAVHVPGSCTVCLAVLQPGSSSSSSSDGGSDDSSSSSGGGGGSSSGGDLRVTLLGDCGARVLRAGGSGSSGSGSSGGGLEVVFATQSQQHSFNMPLQVGWGLGWAWGLGCA